MKELWRIFRKPDEAQDARVSSGKEEIPPEEEGERGTKVYLQKK
jgi:hypothetical protein